MDNPISKTAFDGRFLSPFYRRIYMDRGVAEDEAIKKNLSPPPEKGEAPKEDTNNKRLDNLVESSHQPLLKIRTSIPLDPFPNELIIDINKINVIYRYFFASAHIHSVFIKDISDVMVETSLIFSTLIIVDVGFNENAINIKYLKTGEAIKARKMIQGLIIAHKNGIDLAKCEGANLSDKIEELGKT